MYTLDDSSGACLECVCTLPSPPAQAVGTGIPEHLQQINEVAKAGSSVSLQGKGKGNRIMGDGQGRDIEKEKIPPSVRTPSVPWEEVDVGSVVKIKGMVGVRWGMKQVEVIKVEVLRSTDMEVRCWNEVSAFKRDVLSRSWVVSTEEEEKCKKRREKELRHAARKKTRKGSEGNGKGKEKAVEDCKNREEVERKRKDQERIEKHEEQVKRRKAQAGEAPKAKSKVNYAPLAVRRVLAGKYDALGI